MLAGRLCLARTWPTSPRASCGTGKPAGCSTPGPAPSAWPSRRRAPFPTAACSPCVLPEGDAARRAAARGRARRGDGATSRAWATSSRSAPARWRIREIARRPRRSWSRPRDASARLPFWQRRRAGCGRPGRDAACATAGRVRCATVRRRGLRPTMRPDGAQDAAGRRAAPLRRRPLDSRHAAWSRRRREARQPRRARSPPADARPTGVVPDRHGPLVRRNAARTRTGELAHHPAQPLRPPRPRAVGHGGGRERMRRCTAFDPQVIGRRRRHRRAHSAQTRGGACSGAELFAVRGRRSSRPHGARGRRGRHRRCSRRGSASAPRARCSCRPRPAGESGRPLWQQRFKGGQLLEAARREPGVPHAPGGGARVPAWTCSTCRPLRLVMDGVAAGQRAAWWRPPTSVPSPFAAPLVFGYVGEHLYDGDLPHAEAPRVAALAGPGVAGPASGLGGHGQLPRRGRGMHGSGAAAACRARPSGARRRGGGRPAARPGAAVRERGRRAHAGRRGREEGVPEGAAPDADAEDPGQTAGPDKLAGGGSGAGGAARGPSGVPDAHRRGRAPRRRRRCGAAARGAGRGGSCVGAFGRGRRGRGRRA